MNLYLRGTIKSYLATHNLTPLTTAALALALELEPTHTILVQIGIILADLGYLKSRTMIDGRRRWVYYPNPCPIARPEPALEPPPVPTKGYHLTGPLLARLEAFRKRDGIVSTARVLRVSIATLDKAVSGKGVTRRTYHNILNMLMKMR